MNNWPLADVIAVMTLYCNTVGLLWQNSIILGMSPLTINPALVMSIAVEFTQHHLVGVDIARPYVAYTLSCHWDVKQSKKTYMHMNSNPIISVDVSASLLFDAILNTATPTVIKNASTYLAGTMFP